MNDASNNRQTKGILFLHRNSLSGNCPAPQGRRAPACACTRGFSRVHRPQDDLGEISRTGCRGKAPGPTGWTEELLHIIAVADEDSETGLAFRAILEDIINGNVSEQCARTSWARSSAPPVGRRTGASNTRWGMS